MNNILLCPGPLDVNSIQTSVTSGKCGANSIFIGTTRNNFNNKQVNINLLNETIILKCYELLFYIKIVYNFR